MNKIQNIDALERLRSLITGDLVVEDEVFPRLVQALVRLGGKRAEDLFVEQLLISKSSSMAARLCRMSVLVIGTRAVPLLVQGVSPITSLDRIRASAEVLCNLGTADAHSALMEISKKVRHPVGKEIALSGLEELERAHPTRYVILPKLMKMVDSDRGILEKEMLECDDRTMVGALIENLPGLPKAAKALTLSVIAAKGDALAFRALQQALFRKPETFTPEYSSAIIKLAREFGPAAAEFNEEWAGQWGSNKEDGLWAITAATALTIIPSKELAPLYAQFMDSPFPEVRIKGLNALSALGDPAFIGAIKPLTAMLPEEEYTATVCALAAMGDAKPLEELVRDRSAQKRALAARMCLKAGRKDLWPALALDEERAVRHAAILALETVETDKRPLAEDLAPIISFTTDHDSFEALARTLASIGDAESARRLVSRLKDNDDRISDTVFRVLKLLRMKGAFRLPDMGDQKDELVKALLDRPADASTLGLTGALIEDFDLDTLEKLRTTLLSQPSAVKFGPAQAVTMAVIGRFQILAAQRKSLEEIDEIISSKPVGAREQLEGVNRVSALWLRSEVDLGTDAVEKIEDWMASVAQDKTLARLARKAAIECLAKTASVRVMPVMLRLRASPTDEIANAAQAALEAMVRRFPTALGGADHDDEGMGKRPNVLIVEDDPNIRNLFHTFLYQKGYNAFTAADGEDALNMMGAAKVSVILLDLHMSGMDGFRFLEALGEMRAPPPVIVATSYGDRTTVLRVLKLGAVDFLRKPVDLAELLARVRKVLA